MIWQRYDTKLKRKSGARQGNELSESLLNKDIYNYSVSGSNNMDTKDTDEKGQRWAKT